MTTFSYGDLVAWSTGLPAWMQDALRRLLEKGTLESADISELVELAKRPYLGHSSNVTVPLKPPAGEPSETKMEAVSITGVRDIRRVNALAEGPITFGAEGLSVVYGDNACGKSSLARILKKACRSIVPGGRILPSIDDSDAAAPAEAVVEFVSDGDSGSVAWVDGVRTGGPLDTVNVFDADCARAQVSRANEVSYKPAILRVFELLVETCRRVSQKLQAERTAVGERAPEISNLDLSDDTEAGRLIAGLSVRSEASDVAALCEMGAQERERLEELTGVLRDNPLERAQSIEARVRRIEALDAAVSSASRVLSDEELGYREAERSEVTSTSNAAEVARSTLSGSAVLDGVGTDVWRALWESARRYSEGQAYPGRVFPVTRDNSRCVLCQQELASEAGTRLESFEKFVTSDTQKRADAAAAAYEAGRAGLRELQLPCSARVLRDAELAKTEVGTELRDFIVRAKLRRRHVLHQASGVPPVLPQTPQLRKVIVALRREASNLRDAATAKGREALAKERRELEDRLSIAPLKEALVREVDRLQAEQVLNQAIADCDTRGTTRKAGEAAEIILSGRLNSEFTTNLARLCFTSTGVEVSLGKGELGSHPYAVRLMEDPNVSPDLVLSEGEATCVALAGFFAELEVTGNTSGVVLDDPVSSLDHNYRTSVAKLIAEEASRRQVVVLTHDIAFLWLLRKHAKDAGTRMTESTLERGYKRHGTQKEGPPFAAMTVNKRVGWLRNEIQLAEATLRKEGREAYERRAEFIYTRMRKTWEGAVEERLLNKVVVRFGDAVETRRLGPLSDITEDDIRHVTQQMTRCSGFVHDEPGALHAAIPDPDGVRKDLAALEEWVERLKGRGRSG